MSKYSNPRVDELYQLQRNASGNAEQRKKYISEMFSILDKDVPMVPVIGPLFERPKNENQLAYVMLVNPSFNIKSGSVLTVVLGNYKREHYTVP